MRQIHTYQVIRYFPHVLSDEFVNVGVVLTSGKGTHRIVTEEEAKHIYCSALIGEKKKFLGVVEYLNELASDSRLLEGEHYFHNFRFANEQKIASDKKEGELIDEIFDDYIGFKIHSEKKQEQKEIIFNRSIRLIENEFKSYVRFQKSEQFDFELESIKKHIKHYSNLGRISRKDDVKHMAFVTPSNKLNHERYDFLDMTGSIDLKSHNIQKLQQNYVEAYPYNTEEEIGKYLELVAGAAA